MGEGLGLIGLVKTMTPLKYIFIYNTSTWSLWSNCIQS